MGTSADRVAFSLSGKKRKKSSSKSDGPEDAALKDFGGPIDHDVEEVEQEASSEPLVIPALTDSRQSLQVHAREKRMRQYAEGGMMGSEAIKQEALDAAAESSDESTGENLLINSQMDTFQRNKPKDNDDKAMLESDLQRCADELDVESDTYRKVKIQDFGAALLRGMGWEEPSSREQNDQTEAMPRPSRLGLGATPKVLADGDDAPATHSRKRPRRQDQAQKEQRLREQQEEFRRKEQEQIKMDKQRTLQVGSIVWCTVQGADGAKIRRRAIMQKILGVPGLNMVLVKIEGKTQPEKVKKGSIELVDRRELHAKPFHDARDPAVKAEEKEEPTQKTEYRTVRESAKDRKRDRKADRSKTSLQLWLIPNIKVRVVTSKLGKSYYKEKGVIVDVSHKGVATVSMDKGGVIQAPERYLETALPKPGGNAVILAGSRRLAKGKLLERNSRSSTGVIQVFDDMDVLELSLDDLAEWVGPLDDDLEMT